MNILPNNNCLTQDQIMRYVQDEASPAEMREIDRHIAECAMCCDAVEGVMALGTEVYAAGLTNIDERFEELKVDLPSKTTDSQPLKVTYRSSKRYWFIGAAASVALVAVAGFWYFSQKNEAIDANIAAVEEAKTEATTLPQYAAVDTATSSNISINDKPIAPKNPKTENSPHTIAYQETQPLSKPSIPVEYSLTKTKKEDLATVDQEKIALKSEPSPTVKLDTTGEIAENASFTISNTEKETVKKKEANKDIVATSPAPSSVSKSTDGYQGAANAYPVEEKKARMSPASAKISAKKHENTEGVSETIQKDYNNALFLYKSKKYADAIILFNNVINSEVKGDIYDNSFWYLANAYVESDNTNAAKSILQQIIREKGKYAKNADKLLKKIK